MKEVPGILLAKGNDDEAEQALHAPRPPHIQAEVRGVRDGVEALDLLFDAEPETLPARGPLDLNMPRVGGLEVLRRLRAAPPPTSWWCSPPPTEGVTWSGPTIWGPTATSANRSSTSVSGRRRESRASTGWGSIFPLAAPTRR